MSRLSEFPSRTMRGGCCVFVRRAPGEGGLYTYELLPIRAFDGGTHLDVDQVPAPRDTLSLPGIGGTFRVVARDWTYPTQVPPDETPMPHVQVIVEDAPGPFHDEVVSTEDP